MDAALTIAFAFIWAITIVIGALFVALIVLGIVAVFGVARAHRELDLDERGTMPMGHSIIPPFPSSLD